jgi:hypothetical protein
MLGFEYNLATAFGKVVFEAAIEGTGWFLHFL